jgi:predicted nucleic acid-binding protein
MRVLLDTNVLLDAILQRSPWHREADAILQADALGQVACAATTLSLATVFYVAEKAVGAGKARAAVRKCLGALAILSIEKRTLLDADALAGGDFEDNILIAAAVAASLDAIVTRNVADFAHSPIPVWEPAELLKRLAGADAPPAAGPGQRRGCLSYGLGGACIHEKSRWKPTQLADLLGVGEATVCRWETGAQIQRRAVDRFLASASPAPKQWNCCGRIFG